jgi:hypothetical protein
LVSLISTLAWCCSSGGERAPGWSPFGGDEEWRAFADAVREDAGRRGWRALPEEAVVLDGETRYGLNNLAQI